MLSVRHVKYHVGNKTIINGISTDFKEGLFYVIVGPNGSGKSTFLKIFSGEQKPREGAVLYDEQDVFTLDKTALARRRAVMSQQPELQFPLTVKEIVLFGRYPHFTYRPSANDERICGLAMEKMEVGNLALRDYLTLSGGEKQRVQFARVLAQVWEAKEGEKKFLFLDEAISHLDLKHQHQLLQIAKDFCKSQATIIAILHDLNMAIRYADRILIMKEGAIAYELLNSRDITPGIVKEVFEVDSKILLTENDQPVLVF